MHLTRLPLVAPATAPGSIDELQDHSKTLGPPRLLTGTPAPATDRRPRRGPPRAPIAGAQDKSWAMM
eukprot:223078-Pyramimonas_sp.AAC.1